MLLPSLQKARARGVSASCTANIKQMGLMLVNYISEKSPKVPVQYAVKSNVREYNIPLLYDGDFGNVNDMKFEYMRCPSLPITADLGESAKSYFAYGVPSKPENIPNNIQIKENNAMAINTAKVRSASVFAFFFDTASMNGDSWSQTTRVNFGSFTGTPTNRTGNVHARHGNRANIGFLDGHVAGTTGDELAKILYNSFLDATNTPETLCYYDEKFIQRTTGIGAAK